MAATAPRVRRPKSAAAPAVPLPSSTDFVFHTKSGDTIELPPLGRVERTFALIEAIADSNQETIVVRIVQSATADRPDAYKSIQKLGQKEMSELFTAWSKFSGISLGN